MKSYKVLLAVLLLVFGIGSILVGFATLLFNSSSVPDDTAIPRALMAGTIGFLLVAAGPLVLEIEDAQ